MLYRVSRKTLVLKDPLIYSFAVKSLFDKIPCLTYSRPMFVSIVLDPGGEESARQLVEVLINFGFEKIQRACWESSAMDDQSLIKLKQEIDRVTDYYDTIRMYQFPVKNTMAITSLSKKKWKRLVVKPPK